METPWQGDNESSSETSDDAFKPPPPLPPPPSKEEPWLLAFKELKTLSLQQLNQLNRIEKTNDAIVQCWDAVATRTTKLESIADNNKESIRSIKQEVSSLKENVAEQDITINGLKHYKAEYVAKYEKK